MLGLATDTLGVQDTLTQKIGMTHFEAEDAWRTFGEFNVVVVCTVLDVIARASVCAPDFVAVFIYVVSLPQILSHLFNAF